MQTRVFALEAVQPKVKAIVSPREDLCHSQRSCGKYAIRCSLTENNRNKNNKNSLRNSVAKCHPWLRMTLGGTYQYGGKSGRHLQQWNQSGRMGEGGKVKTADEGGV